MYGPRLNLTVLSYFLAIDTSLLYTSLYCHTVSPTFNPNDNLLFIEYHKVKTSSMLLKVVHHIRLKKKGQPTDT